MLLTAIAVIPLLIWIYLFTARGGFWRVSRHLAPQPAETVAPRRIVAIIPARDEASVIGRALESLFTQELSIPLHIVLVDDGSSDETAGIAKRTAENLGVSAALTILRGQPLKPGWTGKLWALTQGLEYASALAPEYVLFTDADILHRPGAIAGLISAAEAGSYDLVSHMAKLACTFSAEKALIPAFVFFFLKLYPPPWIASEHSKTAGAAGGCMLIRASALNRIGGLARIRNEVIDDCALARAVKKTGGRICLRLTERTESIRSYETFSEIGRLISRTAFNQLHHSALLLFCAIAGLFFTYLVPPLLLFTGKPVPAILGAAAWLIMSLCYLPMVRFYRLSAWWSVTLPAVAAFYMAATVHSAIQYWRGRGGGWKGRIQDVRV